MKVTVKLMPNEMRTNGYSRYEQSEYAKLNENHYEIVKTYEIDGDHEEICEELFDLTNNPSREDERLEMYGNIRSISVGDIINVDGTSYVCEPIGWNRIA